MGDAHGAGFFRLAVPEELHPDVSVFVGRDLLAFLALLAHHLGGLDAVNSRLRSHWKGAEGSVAGLEFVAPVIDLLLWATRSSPGPVVLGAIAVRATDHQVFAIFRADRMSLSAEQCTREQRSRIAVNVAPMIIRLLSLETEFR